MSDNTKTGKRIFLYLVYTFLISSGMSFIIIQVVFNDASGTLEGNQVILIFQLLSILLCFVYFLLSLTALFNVREDVRTNVRLSVRSFFVAPAILFLFVVTACIKSGKNAVDLVPLFPSLSFMLTYIFYFWKFRRHIRNGN